LNPGVGVDGKGSSNLEHELAIRVGGGVEGQLPGQRCCAGEAVNAWCESHASEILAREIRGALKSSSLVDSALEVLLSGEENCIAVMFEAKGDDSGTDGNVSGNTHGCNAYVGEGEARSNDGCDDGAAEETKVSSGAEIDKLAGTNARDGDDKPDDCGRMHLGNWTIKRK
jgi:hypothetical protein